MKASPKSILHSIESVKLKLNKAGLLYSWNDSVVEKTSKGRKRITWASTGTAIDLLTKSDSDIEEYLNFLKEKHYQFQLIDGSLIQLSYEIDSKHNVKSSRLVWYPCPVEFTPEALEYATIEELVTTTPTESILCKAPLRIDFSPDQASENHSSTHLHLGMENFRLPVHRALEPSRFMRLIIRTVYPDTWNSFPDFKETENWSAQDLLHADDKLIGFLSWNTPAIPN